MNPYNNDMITERLVAELAGNYRDGASVLARHAVGLLERFAAEARDTDAALTALPQFAARLAGARPSMHAIARVLQEWRRQFEAHPSRDLQSVTAVCRAVLAMVAQASDDTVGLGVEALSEHRRVLTHSASSTVLRVLERLQAGLSVRATRSEPGGEGERVASSLADSGVQCRLVEDAEAARAVEAVDAFVVGADAVLANGDVINKVGTCDLALAAHRCGVPVIVVAESFKNATGVVPIETTPDGAQPLFDRTPARLISARICDAVFE